MDSTKRQALFSALKSQLPFLLIWANQDGPRPALPYATVLLTASNAIGYATVRGVDDNGVQQLSGQREDSVTVDFFGPGAYDAAARLRDALATTAIRYPLNRAGMALFGSPDTTDITQLLGNVEHEERAQLLFGVRYASRVDDNVGLIETINTAGSTVSALPVDLVIKTRS